MLKEYEERKEYLYGIIQQIQSEYQKAIDPYIKELVRLRSISYEHLMSVPCPPRYEHLITVPIHNSSQNSNKRMKLVYKKTGEDVKIGDIYYFPGGEKVIKVVDIIKPDKPETGRIEVEFSPGRTTLYLPAVIGAVWIEHEDVKIL